MHTKIYILFPLIFSISLTCSSAAFIGEESPYTPAASTLQQDPSESAAIDRIIFREKTSSIDAGFVIDAPREAQKAPSIIDPAYNQWTASAQPELNKPPRDDQPPNESRIPLPQSATISLILAAVGAAVYGRRLKEQRRRPPRRP